MAHYERTKMPQPFRSGALLGPKRFKVAASPVESDWRVRAECRQEDPELFFPVGDGRKAERQTKDAKSVCFRCPVMVDCLKWALDTGQDAGVWGGMSEEERRDLLKRRAKLSRAQVA